MKRSVWIFVAVSALVAGGAAAQAATLYDTNVVADGQGWINGTGNPNGGFTVESTGKVEIGLRAKYRHNPNVIHPTGNVYTVVPGPETNATSGGNGTSGYVAWNYEFSIAMARSPLALTLNNIDAKLTISDGTYSATIDPLAYWSDNTGFGAGGKDNHALPTDWIAQNSENPKFGDFPLITVGGYPGFDMNATGTYTITMDVFAKNTTTLIASDTIRVNVVPLPASAWGGMALLGGLALAKRRKSAAVPA